MPNRILKESICVSASVDKLTWFEEVVFYRLIVNVDDRGRLDARPRILCARLFPLKDVTDGAVTAALARLQEVGLIATYEVEGNPYLHFINWSKHQRVRNIREKYPAPPQVAAIGGLNPIQSESESESESQSNPPNGAGEEEELFGEFWAVYPRKQKRREALEAWRTLAPDAALTARIVAAVKAAARSEQWQQEGGKYVPYPRRYLEERRFEDDPPPPPAGIPSNLDTAMMDELSRRYTPKL